MILQQADNCGIIFECQICFEDYNNSSKKPVVLDCGHSMCYTCLQSIFSSNIRGLKKCPFDNKELKRTMDQYPVNWSYIDIITNYKKFNKPLKEYPNYKELNSSEGTYSGQVDSKNTNVKQGFGQMAYRDGSKYVGYWKNNQKNGKGKFNHPDKREYDGEWGNDLPNGNGKYTFNSGEIKSYEGSWRQGKFFGMGKITYTNNTELETIFVDGVSCCDLYKIKTEDNRTILGQFDQNQIKGKGYEVNNKTGNVYIGLFDKQESSNSCFKVKKNGHGVLHFKDGSKYEGPFENDMLNGTGTLYYPDGSTYEGEFKDNIRNGKGIFTSHNSDIYDGDWFNDKKWGKGVLTRKNGEVYKGQWENDKKSGTGKMMMNNGYSYDGDWSNDKKEGKGVETFPNGESYYGDFANGLKQGKGLFVFENGDTYKGDWFNDKMHGYGILITRDGEEISEKFSNGLIVKEISKEGKDKKCIIF